MKNLLIILLICFALPALAQGQGGSGGNGGGSGGSGQGHDHDRAREAVMRQDALPLATILPGIQQRYRAHMVEVKLESEDGLLVYEIELITPRGHIFEVVVDATTGAVIKGGDDDLEE